MSRAIILLLALFAFACDGVTSHAGLEQPLRMTNGFFHEGELPGIPVSEQPEDLEDLEALSPRVTNLVLGGIGVIRPGQAGIALSGTTTEDAYSIAVRLEGQGSGYWVKAVGVETLEPNEREWDATVDFSPDLAPGRYLLQAVAFDVDGNAGPQSTFRLCVTRDVESSRNACDATVRPPAAAISLRWQSRADVDLVVVTPSGVVVDASHPTTLDLNGGEDVDPDAPGVGVLSIDSNGGCRLDSVQRETLTWNVSPEPGAYQVYAKLYEPCGAVATDLAVDAFVRTRGPEPGTYGFERSADTVHGLLLAQSASGAEGQGLFITTVEFQ